MAEPQSTRADFLADLGEVLAAELEVCSRLVGKAADARCALAARRPEDLLQALRAREDALKELAALERRAGELGCRNADLPIHMRSQRSELRRLADRLSGEEAELQQLANNTLNGMRKQLRGLRAGAQLVRSYRGSASIEPRFSDRRG